MAWIYYDERPYYIASSSDSRCEEPARMMTFREPSYYDDDGYYYYRRDFRDQYPVVSCGAGGYLIPREQVLVRAEDAPLSTWWHNSPSCYPCGRRIVESPQPVPKTTVELYAPQLCCDNCERKVVDCLDHMGGVETVTADQWEKKVVVVGKNLCPDDVLRRLQRKLNMNRSVFWHDRRT